MDNKSNFKPYIPAEKVTPEITVTSIVMGIIFILRIHIQTDSFIFRPINDTFLLVSFDPVNGKTEDKFQKSFAVGFLAHNVAKHEIIF